MIMTACAACRKRKNGTARNVNLFVHNVHAILLAIILIEIHGSQCEKACGHILLITLAIILRRQEIASDLLSDKDVIRLVRIEGVDDIVAVTPRIWKGKISRASHRFTVADNV